MISIVSRECCFTKCIVMDLKLGMQYLHIGVENGDTTLPISTEQHVMNNTFSSRMAAFYHTDACNVGVCT